MHIARTVRRIALLPALAALVFVLAWAPAARAYPFLIGRGHAGCASCHLDPSGGGLLNEFGRLEASDSLTARHPAPPATLQSLFGLLHDSNPDWLLTGGSLRYLALLMKTDGAPTMNSLILMQGDLRLGIDAGRWRAAGSLGFIQNEQSPAAVAGPLVAREYWVGYTFGEGRTLLRAGRMNLPFGVRSIEHTLFVRAATRTDLNDSQQHGVALAWRSGALRGEAMAIAGNYQARPDDFRERGGSGYLEWSPSSRYAVGVSSLVTHVAQDPYLRVANTRQAHGLMARASPIDKLVLLVEVDYVGHSPSGLTRRNGLASMLQVDLEPWQGLHLIATGENHSSGQAGIPTSWGLWGGLGWFFLSHFDVRLDYMHRAAAHGPTRVPVDAFMAQFHLSL